MVVTGEPRSDTPEGAPDLSLKDVDELLEDMDELISEIEYPELCVERYQQKGGD